MKRTNSIIQTPVAPRVRRFQKRFKVTRSKAVAIDKVDNPKVSKKSKNSEGVNSEKSIEKPLPSTNQLATITENQTASEKESDFDKHLFSQRGRSVNRSSARSDSRSSSASSYMSSTSITSLINSRANDSAFRLRDPVFVPVSIELNKNQEVTPKETDVTFGTNTKIIKLEVFKVNGIPFDGVLSDWDILDVWKCLGRDTSEIDQFASTQVRNNCLRIRYVLKAPIQLTEISRKPEFEFDKKGGFRTDVYRVRLADYQNLAYTLGEPVTITIQNTFFDITKEEMIQWIEPFGEVIGEPRY